MPRLKLLLSPLLGGGARWGSKLALLRGDTAAHGAGSQGDPNFSLATTLLHGDAQWPDAEMILLFGIVGALSSAETCHPMLSFRGWRREGCFTQWQPKPCYMLLSLAVFPALWERQC